MAFLTESLNAGVSEVTLPVEYRKKTNESQYDKWMTAFSEVERKADAGGTKIISNYGKSELMPLKIKLQSEKLKMQMDQRHQEDERV